MAKKTYTLNPLSVNSIRALKKELEAYRDSLDDKCQELVMKLTEIGMDIAKARISESPLGKTITLVSNISPDKAGCEAVMLMSGTAKQSDMYEPFYTALAIEFGAGIYYNRGNENPKADELGYGVGTFPNQEHAFEDGWYYKDENGEWKYSHGVKATMPMFLADKEMREQITKIAREVFDS